jgi:hypothetical protein
MLGSILIYVGSLHIRHLHLEMWHNLFIMCPHLHVLLGDIFSLLDVNTDDNLISGSFTKVPKLDGDVTLISHSINVDECVKFWTRFLKQHALGSQTCHDKGCWSCSL